MLLKSTEKKILTLKQVSIKCQGKAYTNHVIVTLVQKSLEFLSGIYVLKHQSPLQLQAINTLDS